MWIKYKDNPMVNLDNCCGIENSNTDNDDVILFDTGNKKIWWSFESEKERNEILNKIKRLVKIIDMEEWYKYEI